jgi:hypothetical protein
MRLAQLLRPKQPTHLKLTAGACVAVGLVYFVGSYRWPWSPKHGLGLGLGVFAALLFVFEMLYPARRPRARPLGTARAWVQAHVYLGSVALAAVLAHSGFAWPRGGIGWWLLILSAWTVASGLVGVWFQKFIPAAMAEGLQVEALYERIPELVAQLLAEADAMMADTGDVLERFYRNEARGPLSKLHDSWSFLFDVRGGRERAIEPFRRILRFVDEAEQPLVEDLLAIYQEKLELDAQWSLQGILRGWLVLHVPPAGVLMGLLVVHIVAWVLY